MFLEALALDLEKTQRAIPSSCLFCVPQPRSLVADQELSVDDLYTHFLIPAGTATDAHARRPGEYDTLNGKTVSIQGSHIHTGRGFDEKRKVRILLSEQREIHHQDVTVLHLSRPLSGGIALPEDPNELDVATFRRFTAILRAFPENELVFYQLDETIAQVKKICTHNQFFNRYETTLPNLLQEEWETAVDEILQAGSFEDDSDDDEGYEQQQPSSHLLQIQQVVECYLMEKLHEFIFPRVVVSCCAQDETLRNVLFRMRHYSPDDFGIRKAFQCDVREAVNTLVDVKDRKTPLDMLLAFKSCIDSINDAITRNLKQHNLDLGRYQMTTDDILDQLLFVLVQAHNHTTLFRFSSSSALDNDDERSDEASASSSSSRELEESAGAEYNDPQNSPSFPIAAVLKYISDYHFINSNTTALGFTIANFQVAVEYFLMRAAHMESCRACIQQSSIANSSSSSSSSSEAILSCTQGVLTSKCELAYARNVRDAQRVTEPKISLGTADADREDDREASGDDGGAFKELFIVGEWSSPLSDNEDDYEVVGRDTTEAADLTAVRVNRVAAPANNSSTSRSTITHIGAGQRFFAAVNDQGQLFTWGDRSGGRLGYASAAGDARRQEIPRRVAGGALEKCHVIHVACGAFHTLATDVNGHVFAWGSNARGQLGFLTHVTTTAETAIAATTVVAAPTLVADLRGTYVGSVACGEYHSLALSSDGRVFSWGCNKYSKLGRATESFAEAVHPKPLNETWTGFALDLKTVRGSEGGKRKKESIVRRIAAGKDHSLVISYDGAAFAWGRGDSGQLGHGSFVDVARPKQVMALSGIIDTTSSTSSQGFSVLDVAGGSDFSLFLTTTGVVFISGRDPSLSSSSSSLASDASTLFPQVIGLPTAHSRDYSQQKQQVVGISCGEAHYALQLASGELLVSNGDSSSSNSSSDLETDNESPVQSGADEDWDDDSERDLKPRQLELVSSLRSVKRVACGGSHTLVVR